MQKAGNRHLIQPNCIYNIYNTLRLRFHRIRILQVSIGMNQGLKIFLVLFTMAIFLTLAGGVFFWAFGAEGSEITDLTAEIKEAVGQVEVQFNPNTDPVSAAEGMVLEAGGIVSTGNDGRARVDLSSGTILRLAENTVFQLEELEISDTGPFARIKIGFGEFWVILAGGSLEADTPSGIASVRGSYLGLHVDEGSGSSFVTCLEGNCAMETQAGKVEMIAGDTARVGDLSILPERGFMTEEMILYWIQNNPEATRIVPAVTATVRATLPEVVLPKLNCLYDGSCVEYCLPGNWDLETGEIPALNQIPNDCIEGLLSFVWQGVNPQTFFVCLAIGGSPQACANNSVRRVFPIEVPEGEDSQVVIPDLACLESGDCARYCVPRGWKPNSGQMPSLSEIPQDCLQAANSLLEQDVDPWLFLQCTYVYGDVAGCAEAAVKP
jgi:hypothetical protein